MPFMVERFSKTLREIDHTDNSLHRDALKE